MRDYGKVFSTFWTSDSTRSLSDDGKMLAFYLLTGPHANLIGCFRLPDGYVSEDLGWSAQRVSKGFGELFRNGFATRDEGSKWVVIHKYLKWNPIENPNQGKAAFKLFEQIPESSGVKPLIARFLADFAGKFLNGFETLLKPFLNPSVTLSKPGTGAGTGAGAEGGGRDGENADAAPAPVYKLPLASKAGEPAREFPVTADLFADWEAAYPLVDVRVELKRMKAWLVSNPANRPARSMPSFVNTWLAKEQDERAKKAAQQSRASPGGEWTSPAQRRLEANKRAADEAELLLFGEHMEEPHATG